MSVSGIRDQLLLEIGFAYNAVQRVNSLFLRCCIQTQTGVPGGRRYPCIKNVIDAVTVAEGVVDGGAATQAACELFDSEEDRQRKER